MLERRLDPVAAAVRIRIALAAFILLAVAGCAPKGNLPNGTDAATGDRWQAIGAFEHFDERIDGEVWYDAKRDEFRFDLHGTGVRLKCIGPGEIDNAVNAAGQCRKVYGDFRLLCGVHRELFGSFEHDSCGYGFAAGIDTLTGSTFALHFGLSPEQQTAREIELAARSEHRPPLLEQDAYLDSGGLDDDIYSLGTGFAITADGLVLTAAHVVEDEYGIRVYAGDRVSDGEVIAMDPKADLALIKTDLRFDPLPLLARDDAPGKSFPGYAVGYRVEPNTPPTQRVETASTHRLTRDPFFGFEGDIIPGYSGGPLFVSPAFKVVGVLHAIAVHYELDDWNDFKIEKIAYAVDYETMMDFLDRSLDDQTMQMIVTRSSGPGERYPVVESPSIVLVTVY